ncbi:MAG: sugar phosphate isomerase/epimerase [Spirochaetes bacterium]|nr:sugar phosphate isomerase/epimerase [Spirochaetota bacterium]
MFAAVLVNAMEPIPDRFKTGGFAIGAQAWSFRLFTAYDAVEKNAQAGGRVIEFFPGQTLSPDATNKRWDHNASDDAIAAMQTKLVSHGMKAVNYGVVGIPNDEAKARVIFDFAKKMGIRAITTESTGSIDVIEKLVKEYDIAVGFHNHPRKDKDPNYKVWDPNYILSVVSNRDLRIGAAPDTGHWIRSGLKPLECLRILSGRLISIHLKDLNTNAANAHDVPYGTGVSDIRSLLDELKRQNFQGNISIEYEYNWNNNVPEITMCIDFVRTNTR